MRSLGSCSGFFCRGAPARILARVFLGMPCQWQSARVQHESGATRVCNETSMVNTRDSHLPHKPSSSISDAWQ